MLHILWLVSLTLPDAATACGLPADTVGGGWLAGQLGALRGQIRLTVCNLDGRVAAPRRGTADGVRFVLLPAGSGEAEFAGLLREETPDLVHLWGTEYPAVAAMQQVAIAAGLPVLVGIQGVMQGCAEAYLGSLPPSVCRSGPVQRAINRVVPGALPDLEKARFDALAQAEAAVLRRATDVTGRTAYDQAFVRALAPNARYHPCNETLRPEFYGGAPWQPRDFGGAPVLLLPQGNYPLKNLDTLLQAMPRVLARWPGAMLRVAGWPPLDKGPLLRPVIRRMFPYQRYCADLAARLGLAGHLEYTGPLPAAAMRQALLDADLFVLPSHCENSPNSLGEAMLLGLPCVASRVGGVPSLLVAPEEGLLYGPAGDAGALADALCAVLARPDGGAALGAAARRRALHTHDPAANAAAMAAIYRSICHVPHTKGAQP